MNKTILSIALWLNCIILITSCATDSVIEQLVYESEILQIYQINENVYRHVSFLNTEEFQNVPCNGMIAINDGEAIIVDSPVDNASSNELLKWAKEDKDLKIWTVIVSHFHMDCLGGLEEFHKANIPSYGFSLTKELAESNGLPSPHYEFKKAFTLNLGSEKIRCRHLGEGHSPDNIVVYYPSEHVLFGGCLIKAYQGGKGNLSDANVAEWPNTVREVKNIYSESKIVIPGHGKPGGQELLDYTIDLFESE